MPAFNALKIARPAFLRVVDREDLKAFFLPFAEYFRARGVEFSNVDQWADEDFERLGEILNRPDNDTPNDLIEALYMITHAAGSEDTDQMLLDAQELGAAIEEEDCPEQVAIKIWTRGPDRIKRRYAESCLVKARSFEYFGAEVERTSVLQPLMCPEIVGDRIPLFDCSYDA